MNPPPRTWSVLVLALAALLAVAPMACLPHAEPGVGEKVLSGRGMADLMFPGTPGEASRGATLLFSREVHQTAAEREESPFPRRDLFVFAPGEGAPQLVAEQFDYIRGFPARQDRLGRLLVRHGGGPFNEERLEATLFHPASRARQDLGRVRSVQLSPCGTWLTYQRADRQVFGRQVDDDRDHALGLEAARGLDVPLAATVGGSLVFLRGDRRLMRIVPGAAQAEELASEVATWQPLPDRPTPALLMSRPAGQDTSQFHVLELAGTAATARPIAGPVGTGATLFSSPGGDRVVLTERPPLGSDGPIQVTVISLDDGAAWRRELPMPPPPSDPTGTRSPRQPVWIVVAFRPASAQVWLFLDGRLHVISPDGGHLFVDREVETSLEIRPAGATRAPLAWDPLDRLARPVSLFTADGGRWLLRDREGRVRLGDAADPTAERGPIVAPRYQFAGEAEVTELTPGGPLAVIREVLGDRRDLHLVEAPWEASRLVLADVDQVMLGASRALAVARKVGSSDEGAGDLVLVDMASGQETPLAQNVAHAALAPACAGCDPTAPGTAMVYVVQARVPFAFDGMWMGRLP